MKENKYNYVIVAGCGKLGASIASSLSSKGKEVVVLDRNNEAFRDLTFGYSGFSICADPTDIDMLMRAGIEKADLVVATMGDDNSNIMIAQIASRIFNVPRVISRLYETDKEIICQGYNIEIIYPSKLSIDEFFTLISDKDMEVRK